jgi:hypothetical protein
MQEENPKLQEFNDRELLELIISNQANMYQLLDRINTFNINTYGKDYIESDREKYQCFDRLMNQNKSLLMQIRRHDMDSGND